MHRLPRPFVFLILLLSGCASAPSRGPLPPDPPRTSVRVENRNFMDMTVYVLRGSQRVRLGTASGASTSLLRIPETVMFGVTSLRFEMNPVGARDRPITHEIVVRPGDEVVLIIP